MPATGWHVQAEGADMTDALIIDEKTGSSAARPCHPQTGFIPKSRRILWGFDPQLPYECTGPMMNIAEKVFL
ncbi:MAG: hypothetical protein MI923_23780 [Phycisphaerales bacterium]|nr:hypothetical protein [Phycisphaerales bacterium]